MVKEKVKGKMTVAEAGRKGGEKTAQTHGREFYQEIGHKRGKRNFATHGPEFYSEICSKGGSERTKNLKKNKE